MNGPGLELLRAGSARLAMAPRLCWLFVLLLLATQLPAQQLHIRTFTPDEGLAASQIWAIYQDRIGYLWFGTAAGLSRYDGTSFSTLTVADGLPDPLVRTIVQSPDGRLWFGTNAGLASFDGRTFHKYGEKDGLGKGPVWASAVDIHGGLWFGTQDGGLSVYDGVSFRTYTHRDGLPGSYVYSLLCSRDGTMWLGTREGEVARFTTGRRAEPTALKVYGKIDGLPNDPVRAIAEDRSGNLYFGMRGGGIARVDGSRFTTIGPRPGFEGTDVYALTVNRNGELVVGTVDAGVSICDVPGFQHCRAITKQNGLHVDSVYALFEDRERNLWIGLNNGVSQLVTEAFRSYGESEGLPDNGVLALFPDRNGDVWLGTSRGLARGRPDPVSGALRFTTFTTKDGLASNGVWDVLRDRAGDLWVATRSGLCRWRDDGRFETFTRADGLANDFVYGLFEDRAGNLWLATLEGVSKAAPRERGERPRFASYTAKSGLNASQIYTIAEDHGGNIWIGTAGEGIAVFDGSGFRRYTTANGLGSNSINAITIGRDGVVWIGTGGGGLARFTGAGPSSGAEFVCFGAKAGISSDSVAAVVEETNGLLWLGTSRGVDLFDPHRLRGDVEGAVIRHLDNQNGLAGNEALASHGISRASDGTLWLGTSHGVTQFRPSLDTPPPAPPVVAVRRVVVAGHKTYYSPFVASASNTRSSFDVLSSHPLVMAPDQNSLHVEFRALSYCSPDSARYSVQLVGFDPDWLEETSVPFKEYTNLPPGNYEFRVRARVERGAWGPPSAPLQFVVQPRLWQTWWARAAIAVLAILIAYVVYILRTRRLRTRQRELEAIIEHRTSELARRANELEQANRDIQDANRTKSRFLASMSHELRTPLNAIIGFSEVLAARLDDRADTKELKFLQNIRESGQHLLHLINNLLDLSKIEAGHMEMNEQAIEFAPLIERVRAVLAGVASQRGIDIIVRAEEPLPPVLADEAKLRQILLNLISNAIKFSYDSQPVEIEARFRPAAESPIRVNSIEIAIIDHGIGIKAEDQNMLFDEFRQAEGGVARGGTGLGLAIVRSLVELHRGIVTIESVPGTGSTFRVFLPAAASDVETARDPSNAVAAKA